MADNRKPMCLIMGCSKRKDEISKEVCEFYKGQLFNMLKKVCKIQCIDYIVLSGKYGILFPHEIVEPYNQKIQNNKEDIQRVRKLSIPRIRPLLKYYRKLLVVMGKTYRNVIAPLFSEFPNKFEIFHSEKGIFGYVKTAAEWRKMDRRVFFSQFFNVSELEIIFQNYIPINNLERWVK